MLKSAGLGVGTEAPKLAPRLGLFDATMIAMGGVIGSGIFVNPSIVARQVHSPVLILAEWVAGGFLALLGALIYGELGARLPRVGGEYAYLREGLHPILGFFCGWVALLVINAGGTAAVSLVFAKYLQQLTPLPVSERVLAAGTIAILTVINCAGVRAGSDVQSALMLLRAAGVATLIAAGTWCYWHGVAVSRIPWHPVLDRPASIDLAVAFGAGMIPVLFAYGGWQTANFVATEIREPRKNLPRALLLGTMGVVVLYVGVSFACIAILGTDGLAATNTPASEVMRRTMGTKGASLIALGIAVSALGFLSQSVLTYPRVFFAMAADGLFPPGVARVNRRTHVPVVAIILASLLTIGVLLVAHYESILTYVESMDGLFLGMTALTLIVLRGRERQREHRNTGERESEKQPFVRVPGHPWTTLVFVLANWLVVANSFYRYRANAALVLGILLAGIPVYWFWSRRSTQPQTSRPRNQT